MLDLHLRGFRDTRHTKIMYTENKVFFFFSGEIRLAMISRANGKYDFLLPFPAYSIIKASHSDDERVFTQMLLMTHPIYLLYKLAKVNGRLHERKPVPIDK